MSPAIRTALCTAVAVALVVPGVAQAAQKSVDMGTPLKAQKGLQRSGIDINDFFPHRVTIHVGDTVRFVPVGFHTVDLPGRRSEALPLFTPTGQPVTGALDAAGAPFWFNGQSMLGFNPLLGKSGFGKRFSYTGAKAVLSGIPAGNRPKPMTVRFAKAGSFRYFCDVHPGMTGRVVVRSAGRAVPSAAADTKAVNAQLTTARSVARTVVSSPKPPANIVDVGRQGKRNVSLFAFVPSTLTVPVGTIVTFRNRARSEVHTATTGPGNPESEPNSYLGSLTASLDSPSPNQAFFYPSDPPPGPAALTPTLHGNGFWNSGVLDLIAGTPPRPSNTVRFAAPGTYQFYCLVHPFMHATVTAQ